jgi:hypothetical protein
MGYAVIMAGPLEFWGTYWLGTSDFALTLQAILMATPTIALFAVGPVGFNPMEHFSCLSRPHDR